MIEFRSRSLAIGAENPTLSKLLRDTYDARAAMPSCKPSRSGVLARSSLAIGLKLLRPREVLPLRR